MHKTLIQHPSIGSYSFFLFLGLLCGYLLSRFRARRFEMAGAHVDNVCLIAAIGGLFGARLFSWFFYFPPGISLWKALIEPSGGMVFYGGVICGFLGALIYCLVRRVSLARLLDVLAPGLMLGLGLGRIGCFMAGCCWGDICTDTGSLMAPGGKPLLWQIQTAPALSSANFPLAVRFPRDAGAFEQHVKLGLVNGNAARSLPVHPVQLYEAALAIGFCILLARLSPARRRTGEVICLMFLGYAAIRFTTEFLRADNAPAYAGFTLSQVISLSLAIAAGAAMIVIKRWPVVQAHSSVTDTSLRKSHTETVSLVP